MEDVLLLEALERYMTGEMSAHEKMLFEELRKNNPEVDQMVVEHSYFINELDKFNATRQFKHSIHEVEAKLIDEGLITQPKLEGKAKVVYLWKKYKRSVAVAASIAALISICTSGLLFNYSTKQGNENYDRLSRIITETSEKIDNTTEKINNINDAVASSNTIKHAPPKANIGGTGFLVDGKGYLVTNTHVIDAMKNIYVKNNKGEYFTASAIYRDNTCDLAILKITDTAFKQINNLPYSIRKGNADLGEQFFTLGFPRNEIVYGEGYLSAKSGNDGDSTAYQLTVSANPGNSGAPVVNRNGEIIAIITGKDNKADGVVFAAKSKNIYKLLEQLKKSGDDKVNNIKTPTNNGLKGLDRTQQVKKMEEFVFMVVGN